MAGTRKPIAVLLVACVAASLLAGIAGGLLRVGIVLPGGAEAAWLPRAALAHAERCLALSYPRDVWYVRLGMMVENGQRRLTGNSFRTFVHPVPPIEAMIVRGGFRLSSRRQTPMWSADVYVRAV